MVTVVVCLQCKIGHPMPTSTTLGVMRPIKRSASPVLMSLMTRMALRPLRSVMIDDRAAVLSVLVDASSLLALFKDTLDARLSLKSIEIYQQLWHLYQKIYTAF
jgi:hypothetical protein